MPQRANVRSVEAIDEFRSRLVVYLSQAKPAVEEVTADVLRTRLWIENEQRTHWEHQLWRRRKLLEEAQQALFSARLGSLRKESAVEQMAFHRAKRALEEAESKLRVLKKWAREFDSVVQPLLKQVEKLHTVLSNDMPQAVAYLSQTTRTLAAYVHVQAMSGQAALPAAGPGAAPAAAEESPAGPGAKAK